MPTKEETRLAILDAAQALFSRFGPMRTSVADIARELGMSPANIYNFYPSRDAILEAVGERHVMALRLRLERETDQLAGEWPKIERLFLTNARHLRDGLLNEKNVLQLVAIERKQQWRFVADFHQFLRTRIEELLREGIAAGRLSHRDPARAASALFDCMWTSLDPLLVLRLEPAEHQKRLKAQLALLALAFR
jgi:AcrR family transcriptional regulator